MPFRRISRAPLPLAAAAAAVALAASAAGCGGSSHPLQTVVGAAKKTLAFPAASYDLALDRPRLFGPSVDVLGGKAAYDLAAGIGYEALTVRRGDGGTRTVYLDFLPDAVYVAPWPTPAGLLPDGKIWIAVAFTGAPAATNRALAPQLEGLAPELPLAEIVWGARSATHVGTRVVRHVPMQEYRVTVDLAKALAAARRTKRAAVAAAIAGELRAPGSNRLSLAVYVTGPGHIARIAGTVPGSGLGTTMFAFTTFHAQFTHNPPRRSQSVPLGAIAEPRFLWTIATSS